MRASAGGETAGRSARRLRIAGIATLVATVITIVVVRAERGEPPDHAVSIDAATTNGLADVERRVADVCAAPSEDVRVVVTIADDAYDVRRTCRDIQSGLLRRDLVDLVAGRNDASAKARRLVALRDQFGIPTGAVDETTWGLASRDPAACASTDDLERNGSLLDEGRVHGETAEEWTLIEAVTLAAVCPEHLESFFQTVVALGEPDAAARVRARLAPVL